MCKVTHCILLNSHLFLCHNQVAAQAKSYILLLWWRIKYNIFVVLFSTMSAEGAGHQGTQVNHCGVFLDNWGMDWVWFGLCWPCMAKSASNQSPRMFQTLRAEKNKLLENIQHMQQELISWVLWANPRKGSSSEIQRGLVHNFFLLLLGMGWVSSCYVNLTAIFLKGWIHCTVNWSLHRLLRYELNLKLISSQLSCISRGRTKLISCRCWDNSGVWSH